MGEVAEVVGSIELDSMGSIREWKVYLVNCHRNFKTVVCPLLFVRSIEADPTGSLWFAS